MLGLAVIFGAAVGVSLGLTGGGGSILAVPMLVYGLGVLPSEAVGVSLAAVGSTSLIGAVERLLRNEVEVRISLLFAATGMAGAPVGSWIGKHLSDMWLLFSFAILMLWVAVRMWLKATRRPAKAAVVRAPLTAPVESADCPADSLQAPGITPDRIAILWAAGLITGILSGLYGVGGGFVIVPALVLFGGVTIHRAVASSLLVIPLVATSGLIAYLLSGRPLQTQLTLLFVLGGVLGMAAGTAIGRRLSPVRLQMVFAVVIVIIACFVIVKNLNASH